MIDTTPTPVAEQAGVEVPRYREVIVLTALPVLRPCRSFDAPCGCGKGNASDCPRDETCKT